MSTTAKELLLAAGWKIRENSTKPFFLATDGVHHRTNWNTDPADDNLTDMLIRELSREQMEEFESNLCSTVRSGIQVCTYGASLLRATHEQKAQALMETYKEKE